MVQGDCEVTAMLQQSTRGQLAGDARIWRCSRASGGQSRCRRVNSDSVLFVYADGREELSVAA